MISGYLQQEMLMGRKKIHLLGDSLIGFGSWHILLPDYETINDGIPGETSDELLCRLPPRARGAVPDCFVVMTGTNNLLLYGQSAFTETIREIVVVLRQAFSETPVILTSLLPFGIGRARASILSLNDEYALIAEKSGAVYFDLFTPFDRSEIDLFELDGVHLNREGYLLWGRHLNQLLQGLLAKEQD